jgi:hypothetical protein
VNDFFEFGNKLRIGFAIQAHVFRLARVARFPTNPTRQWALTVAQHVMAFYNLI